MNAVAGTAVENQSIQARVVDLLLARRRLKEADLVRARQLQDEAGLDLLAVLGRLGLVSERDHAEACAEVMGLELLEARAIADTPPESLPEVQALSPRFLRMQRMPREAFDAGEWRESLEAAMSLPEPAEAIPTDGASACARLIASYIGV